MRTNKRAVALQESNSLHCLTATEESLEKNCRSINAVTKRMAAPGCGSERARRRETVVHPHFHVMAFGIGATQAAFIF